MSYYLIQQVATIENINIRTGTEVVEAHGDEHLEAVTVCDPAGRGLGRVEAFKEPEAGGVDL